MLDWDSRRHYQQLKHWQRMTPNKTLYWSQTSSIKIQKKNTKKEEIYKNL